MTKVTITMPAEAALKIINDPTAFKKWAKESGLDIEDVYLSKESMYELCPACNSPHKTPFKNKTISQCCDCAAIFGKTDIGTVQQFIHTNKMVANARDTFYFDFTLENKERMHGWADADSKAVVQWG